MYGMHVHEAVIAAGDTVTGITIHYINSCYARDVSSFRRNALYCLATAP